MSFCYADDETSDPVSSPSPTAASTQRQDQTTENSYHSPLMPESPLQTKLPNNNQLNRISTSMSPNSQLEQEKRVRREIANSNERRRMQSINTGFQSLKILIPHSCGEKLSKACILQRAADHIKSLENEKIKLQSQNEQFRILIKSFQIDSSSVLQAQRRLSTNDPDETVLLLNNESKSTVNDDDIHHSSSYSDVKTRHSYHSTWHSADQHYPSTSKDDPQFYSNPSYRTNPTFNSKTSANTNPDSPYMIVRPSSPPPPPPPPPAPPATQPSQRSYKTNSLDQTNENGIGILERCSLRAQSVDTNNNSSPPSNVLQHPVSRRNLQTIVEAIRHLEGDEVLSNMTSSASTISHYHHHHHHRHHHHQDDLPPQIKAMIHEKFQQQQQQQQSASTTKTSFYSPQQNTTATHSFTHEIDLHQKPPKKRKITFNENDDFIDQPLPIPKQELPPISSPDVHHHEQISSDSPPSNSDHSLHHSSTSIVNPHFNDHSRSHSYVYSSRHPT